MIKRKTVTLIALVTFMVAGMVFSAGVASANSVGQCNVYPGNTVTSVSELLSVLRKERVTGQAKKVFRSAGYHPTDQSLRQWMGQRVIRARSHRSFRAVDYGCRNGRLFSVGTRSYGRGKSIFVALPKAYAKGDFRTRRSGSYNKKIVIRVRAIALSDCGNPVKGSTTIVIWVKGHKLPPPPVKPPNGDGGQVVVCQTGYILVGNTCVQQVITCSAGFVLNAQGNCVQQTNLAQQNCEAQGGSYNTITNLCTIIQVTGNCSNITVINGSNNVVEVRQEGNCNSSTPPPPAQCPDGSLVPPSGICDRPPTIMHIGQTAHTMPGNWRYVWFRVTDPDGDGVDSFNIVGSSPYAHLVVNGEVSMVPGDTGEVPCPTGSQCFRATLWADYVPAGTGPEGVQAEFTAIASAGGKDANPLPLSFTIIPVIP